MAILWMKEKKKEGGDGEMTLFWHKCVFVTEEIWFKIKSIENL